MPGSADYRRRADEYRALSTKAANKGEREGLLSVAMLLEAFAQHEVERKETQKQPKRWPPQFAKPISDKTSALSD
jgi:hypothetical protein